MKRDSLPPFQIGRYSQLQEWLNDWDRPMIIIDMYLRYTDYFPSNQISPYYTPKLAEASRNLLIDRGDESTGWSMAWKVNLWARLLDGDHAYKLIRDILRYASSDKILRQQVHILIY